MPHGLQIVSSNRLEALAERLATSVAAPRPGDPLGPEWIVTQSRGMARWVQLQLARRLGLCARVEFTLPREFLRTIGRLAVPGAALDPRFERDALLWRLWDGLDHPAGLPAVPGTHAPNSSDPRRRFETAARIAGVFDQYLVYRPDLLAGWEAGRDTDWQAVLWRAACVGTEPPWHEARWLRATAERLRRGPLDALPERVAWFAIATLPPAYLDVLAALGRHAEVTLFTLQPTEHYWGDLVPRRRTPHRAPGEAPAPAGPRLLVSLGRLGRSFQRQLAEHGAGGGGDPFGEPGDDTLLHSVQSDLLHLRVPQPGDDLRPPLASDPSLRLHSCHSPRRELEVLQDQILDALDGDPTLGPADVLVLTPDIEAYAPQIHAVFGAPEEERLRLPYTVADRVPRAESRMADAFLRVLRLPEGRCGRSDLEPLFEVSAVQRRFGWTPADVSILQERIEALGIRWGMDSDHRARLGVPAFPQGTWRHGVDRLLLGMAMAEDDDALLGDLSPAPGMEGHTVSVAAGLASFIAAVQSLLRVQGREHRLSEWPALLDSVLDSFLAPEAGEREELLGLRSTLQRLARAGRDAGTDPQVALPAVRAQLEQWLAEERSSGGFLRGGITFAALKPLRSIPARFLAVLGLNDTAFPRRPVPVEFDRIAAEPREGDEAREADDRHLFLETLLSARDRLHLSYVGQSSRDNAPLPPSVVLSDLLDHLADRMSGDVDTVRKAVLVRHPLHGFSPEYFNGTADGRLFSFSAENARAARVSAGGPAIDAAPFLESPLPPPLASDEAVALETLSRFLRNPARHFLEERLGVRLPEEGSAPEDRESFTLTGLDRFRVRQAWLDHLRSGGDPGRLQERQRADGELPAGPAGRIAARGLESDMRRLLEALPPEGLQELSPVPLELHVSGTPLHGSVGGLTPWGLLQVRPARFKPGDLLDLWLRLVVLTAQNPSGPPRAAHLVALGDRDAVVRHHLKAPSEPDRILPPLVALLREGSRRPLPFFARAASELTRPVGSRVRTPPLARALAAWFGSEHSPGESADPWVARCFGRVEPHPLDAEFQSLAHQVFTPLWAHWTEDPA